MSVKSRSDLIDEIVAQITANGIEAITGPIVQSLLKDLADSSVNMLGDPAIQGKLGYSTLISITASGDIVYKDWVENQVVFASQIWRDTDPDYGHRWKVTIDRNGEFQKEDLGV